MQRPAGRSCAIDAISVLQADLYICDVVVVKYFSVIYIFVMLPGMSLFQEPANLKPCLHHTETTELVNLWLVAE